MNTSTRPADERNRKSYRKTLILAIVGACVSGLTVVACLARGHDAVGAILAAAAWIVCGLCLIVAAGGFVVLVRDQRERDGKPDLFAEAYARQPAQYSVGWRRWIRPILGRALRPGDVVIVRPAMEIRRTLVNGVVNGLPFMPEMLAYCGRKFVVDRRIDKINDWPGGNELRRVRGVVTLVA